MTPLKKILRIVLSKPFALALLALLQIALLLALVLLFAGAGIAAYVCMSILTVLVLMGVQSKDDLNPAYKLMWTLVLILMPVFGTAFYVLWGHRTMPRGARRKLGEIERAARAAQPPCEGALRELSSHSPYLAQSARYLARYAAAPLYPAEGRAEYYPTGEDFFPRFLEELREAKEYIFLEYYIVEEGVMLNAVLELLRAKAAQGVDVRFIWDGFGSLMSLPPGFQKRLRAAGIKCGVFSPLRFTFYVSHYAMLNHRDHRKLTVIDGRVAFSGGLNLADEYINARRRFGVWKDTAFLVRGGAAASLAAIFLRTWDYVTGEATDLSRYLPRAAAQGAPQGGGEYSRGYIQPYCDSPLDGENVSENAYLNVIRHARDYVYISTPYLILDHEMITALTLAAKSGVDVRSLTPGVPDKRAVFLVTQSYFPALLRAGVRIYSYTPGFNHAKMYVSDDAAAIVGSANMDYRSLYLHFESCVAFYGGEVVHRAKRDMLESFAAAREITRGEADNISPARRLLHIVAKFFAPML